jgi:CelD/BcsL family acetyltransferase involved in cellulose biosynthesis
MIKIIDSINGLKSIEEDCNRLADIVQMPLFRYEWLLNCARVLNKEKLFVLVQLSENRIKAIAPLVIVKRNLRERIEILGASLHNEPGGILFEDDQSLLELLKEISQYSGPVVFNRIRDFPSESLLFPRTNSGKRKIVSTGTACIPYLPVTCSYENYQQTISPGRRSDLRRLMRIAAGIGNLSVEIVAPSSAEIDSYIDEIFETEASGWKKRVHTAMITDCRLGVFFRQYMRDAAGLGMLRLCYLRIQDTCVAAIAGIVHSNRFWILKTGYDERYAKCSPGILVMDEVIRYVFSKNLEAVEFLGSDEGWIHLWTKHYHRLYTYKIYDSLLYSILDVGLFNVIRLLKFGQWFLVRRPGQFRIFQNV